MTSAMSRPHRLAGVDDRDFTDLELAHGVLYQRSGGLTMMSALRLILIPLFFALMLSSPAAAARNLRHERPDDSGECLRLASRDEVLAGALRSGLLGRTSNDRELDAAA